ncbi:uncharacterized protein BX663DRAFT_553516 [Cokeromyces recurvatus]|uniref:uncharacterized protein n=1 Tax=Cokeromyces recurvatus TaxID=90255 RepID=UPI0022204AD8|nr:uncharacterized protein BX663DRAFT_553516 [Cokeromyces recurvatus]KAI7900873.1 hypothetical protein BX663DRAFT_553516 [Cokeromyces recurvatus]
MDIKRLRQDPLFNSNVRLFIKDIHEIKRVQTQPFEVFKLHDHFIHKADVYGIIVGFEKYGSRYYYLVDDGTAIIECFAPDDEQTGDIELKPIFEIGDIARAFGDIITARSNKRQIKARAMYPVEDPNMELLHYIQTIRDSREHKKGFNLPEQAIDTDESEDEYENTPIIAIRRSEGFKSNEREIFQRALLQKIKERDSDLFTPNTYRDTPELIKLAKHAIKAETNGNEPIEAEITTFFNENIQSLVNIGCIIEVYGRNMVYRLVDNKHLAQVIINIMKEAKQIGDGSAGIFKEYIRIKVSENEYYRNLCQKETKVNEILDLLTENSIICMLDNDKYDLIF